MENTRQGVKTNQTPKYNCTWDPQQVIAFLGTWENSQISLQHLSYKVATLLALVTGQRIQTISLIRPSNLMESPSSIQILITDQIKTSNINKLQPCLQIPFFLEDPSICPATALKHYLNIYEVSHCGTQDGSLVENIMGAYSFKETEAIKRGKSLEKQVVAALEKIESIKIHKCGFILNKNFPIVGVSPDGITDEFVIEVKCPSKNKNFKNYICNGAPRKKIMAQIQLQMYFMGKKEDIFCIAHDNFESTDVLVTKSPRKTGFLGSLICINSVKQFYSKFFDNRKIKYILTNKFFQDH
nr:unnamed protein product [Callosobruchus chinensis]